MASEAKIGQGDALAQTLVALLGRGDRPADEDPLGERDHTVAQSRSAVAAVRARMRRHRAPLRSPRARRHRRVRPGRLVARPTRSLDDGHTVAIIDRAPRRSPASGPNFAGTTVQGIGFDRDRLIEAGIEQAGARSPPSPAATTPTSSWPGSPARTSASSRSWPASTTRGGPSIYQRLGIQTVATVAWTTDQVLRRLLPDARRPPSGPTRPPRCALVDRRARTTAGRASRSRRLEDAHRRHASWRSTGWARRSSPTARTVAQAGDRALRGRRARTASPRSTPPWRRRQPDGMRSLTCGS